jgi:hypothetical protein
VSQRLWNRGRVHTPRAPPLQTRNYSIYSPGTSPGEYLFPPGNRRPFESERHLLPRDDILRGTFLCCEPSSYLIRLPRYDQVLTGIFPYDGGDETDVVTDIRLGKRPSRPMDSTQNQRLQDPVWDTISACWSGEPGQRPRLSVVYQAFSRSGRRVVKRGDLSTQNDGNPTMAERYQI